MGKKAGMYVGRSHPSRIWVLASVANLPHDGSLNDGDETSGGEGNKTGSEY